MKSLTALCNGGILLEMLSKEAAQWLSVSSNLENLSTATGGELLIKARTFNIVVPFLPTSMVIKEVDILCAIEEDNKLPHRSITMACWIKPPCRRENEQCIAHAMFHMSSPEAANRLILDGLYHDMEHLHPVKDKKEPTSANPLFWDCQVWVFSRSKSR